LKRFNISEFKVASENQRSRGAAMKKTLILNQEETIRGIIKEIDDDENSAIAILADGEYYIVEMNKQGKKLLDEIESKVEATGSIKTDPDGTNRITVNYFEVLDAEDDIFDDQDRSNDNCCEDEENW
jgi:NurA-like 5'-3' nuclease